MTDEVDWDEVFRADHAAMIRVGRLLECRVFFANPLYLKRFPAPKHAQADVVLAAAFGHGRVITFTNERYCAKTFDPRSRS